MSNAATYLRVKAGDAFADNYKRDDATMDYLVVVEFRNGGFEEEWYDDYNAACSHAEDSAGHPNVFTAYVEDFADNERVNF